MPWLRQSTAPFLLLGVSSLVDSVTTFCQQRLPNPLLAGLSIDSEESPLWA
jgi:hypothetical protein